VQLAADMAIAIAWLAVLAHNLALGFRARQPRPLRVRLLAGLVVLAVTAVVGLRLERLTGRLVDSGGLALVGAGVAIVGACLHLVARSVLGPAWSSGVAPQSSGLVADGPYGVVRHPLYAGILLLTLGTVVGHPSVATLCGAVGLTVGLALKIRREERALATAFGPQWDAYRARVPALVPRLRRS
jgi:protein-S-isoprenylcysteine O-methyltransferase Ste14